MTKIESEFKPVNEKAEKVFGFLNQVNNHRLLMPNAVTDWWSDNEQAKMKIQGLGSLHLKIGESIPHSFIRVVPASKPPVDLNIEWNIEPDGDNAKVKVAINADLNMMMRMVATKPLQNLADYMANHLSDAMDKTA